MKKLLDIKFSRLNKMEQLLKDIGFFKKYKIGISTNTKKRFKFSKISNSNIGKLTLGKNYIEDKYDIHSLGILPCRVTEDTGEIFGRYSDQCGKHYSEKHCVLSEDKESYIMTINNEQISGPYTEGYEHYEYDDGDTPMEEFAYGVIASRFTIFKLSKSLSNEEIIVELDKILVANDYYFNPEYKQKREFDRIIKKKKEQMEILSTEIDKLEKEKIKKTEKYLNLKKELGL